MKGKVDDDANDGEVAVHEFGGERIEESDDSDFYGKRNCCSCVNETKRMLLAELMIEFETINFAFVCKFANKIVPRFCFAERVDSNVRNSIVCSLCCSLPRCSCPVVTSHKVRFDLSGGGFTMRFSDGQRHENCTTTCPDFPLLALGSNKYLRLI